jgi:hypothetical protein
VDGQTALTLMNCRIIRWMGEEAGRHLSPGALLPRVARSVAMLMATQIVQLLLHEITSNDWTYSPSYLQETLFEIQESKHLFTQSCEICLDTNCCNSADSALCNARLQTDCLVLLHDMSILNISACDSRNARIFIIRFAVLAFFNSQTSIDI